MSQIHKSNGVGKIKKIIKNLVFVTIPTLLILFLLLELFFRFVIPASNPPTAYFDEENLMYKSCIDNKEGLYTMGKLAEYRMKWRINNHGWNSPVDYKKEKDKTRIAIIGDSYIEALQVDTDKSYPSLLRERMGKDHDVYSFGKTGAPLSQYLHISRYVNKYFNPDIIIFNIIHNDFDKSILRLNPTRYYFLTLNVSDSGITENTPRPNYSFRQYNLIKRWIRKSALVRYLLFNLHIKETIQRLFSRNEKKYNANIKYNKVRDNIGPIRKAVEYILNRIRQENEGKRIIFVMDAPRNDIYTNNLERSNVMFLHDMMNELCAKNDFEFLDLTGSMKKDYQLNHTKFDFEFEGHWNEYGHHFVCEQVLKLLKNKAR